MLQLHRSEEWVNLSAYTSQPDIQLIGLSTPDLFCNTYPDNHRLDRWLGNTVLCRRHQNQNLNFNRNLWLLLIYITGRCAFTLGMLHGSNSDSNPDFRQHSQQHILYYSKVYLLYKLNKLCFPS